MTQSLFQKDQKDNSRQLTLTMEDLFMVTKANLMKNLTTQDITTTSLRENITTTSLKENITTTSHLENITTTSHLENITTTSLTEIRIATISLIEIIIATVSLVEGALTRTLLEETTNLETKMMVIDGAKEDLRKIEEIIDHPREVES